MTNRISSLFLLLMFLYPAPQAFAGSYANVSPAGDVHWKKPVASVAALPASGNASGDARTALDTFQVYLWNGSAWVSGGTVAAVTASSPLASSGGTSPNITCQAASGSQAGCLASADFATFSGTTTTVNAATSADTASTIVKRGASGQFSAGALNLLNAPVPGTPGSATVISTGDPNTVGLQIQGDFNAGSLPAHSTFYASFASSINADSGGGSLTGTPNGGAAVSGGKLNLTGSVNKFLTFAASGNVTLLQTGTVRFAYTPNYSGTPSSEQGIYISQVGSINNTILISDYTDGKLYGQTFSSAGANISTVSGAWAPTSGQTYLIELDFDLTAGATRMFVDGVQFGTTGAGTGTRAATYDTIILGNQQNEGGANANFSLDHFILFDTVQHTSDFAGELPFVYGDQTSDLQQWLSSASAVLGKVSAGGVATFVGEILSGLTASTVPYLDAAKRLVSSAVTPTELGWLSGVTSAIQTQINAKLTSPLTTKGDVLGYSTVNARVPVGSNGQVLTADSTQTLGVKWASAGGTGDILNGGQTGPISVGTTDNTLFSLLSNNATSFSVSSTVNTSAKNLNFSGSSSNANIQYGGNTIIDFGDSIIKTNGGSTWVDYGNRVLQDSGSNSVVFWQSSGLRFSGTGHGLTYKAGSNARAGTATMSGGTVTVSNTSVTANSLIFLTAIGSTAAGAVSVANITASTGFDIISTNVVDARVVQWMIVESQ